VRDKLEAKNTKICTWRMRRRRRRRRRRRLGNKKAKEAVA
jgi:hypothetical protein